MAQSYFRTKIKLILFFISLLAFLFILPEFILCDDVDYPSYTGFINDYAGKLDSSSRQSLEDLASRVEKDTGSEIAVVIVDNLQGLTQEEYAVELFERWGIGKKEEDNGILILIGIEGEAGKRPLRIEVGYGLEGVITDIEAGNIADDILIPELQKGDFYKGLYLTIMAIADKIYEEKGDLGILCRRFLFPGLSLGLLHRISLYNDYCRNNNQLIQKKVPQVQKIKRRLY